MLPGIGNVPLNGLWLHATFGGVAAGVFQNFVGPLDPFGMAQPLLNVPLWPELVNRQVSAAAVIFDPAGPAGIGMISNGTQTSLTMPLASITAVNPPSGGTAGGTPVSISGQNFVGGAAVSFDGVAATSVSVVSPQLITCVTPSHLPGVVNVSVANTGTAAAVAIGAYTYATSASAPQLSAVVPADGPIAGGASMTLQGSGFQSGIVVRFGTQLATNVVVATSGNSLTCTLPAGAVGAVAVQLLNPDLQQSLTPGAFTYLPNLWVFMVNPGAPAPGQTVNVLGAGFQSGLVLTQGATPIPVSIAHQGLLSFVAPAGLACGGPLTFTNPSGQSANQAFNAPPVFGSITPASGPVAGGNTVTINGAGFSSASTVTVGGVPATIVSSSATTIQLVMPAGTAGAQAVVITAPNLCTASGTYTFN
jgi:hypothetical protein